MLPFAESFVAIVAALVLPAFVGLVLIMAAARFVRPRYLAAFAFGIYLWFFSDTAGDSSYLGVNSGFAGGLGQLSLVLLFAVGILLVFSLDRKAFGVAPTTGLSLTIPLLVAFAVGFHGFGEGAAFSATAAATPSGNLLDAFGGISAAVAFVLHKGLEPMMIGAVYSAYASDRAKGMGGLLKDVSLLTLVFVLPGVVGGATNYFLGYDITYIFAFSLGVSIYAPVMLARLLFSETTTSNSDSLKMAVLVLFGLLCIYFAALFHA